MKQYYDGVVLTEELRHLGGCMPWLRMRSQPKTRWVAGFFRVFVEISAVVVIIGILATRL